MVQLKVLEPINTLMAVLIQESGFKINNMGKEKKSGLINLFMKGSIPMV